MYHQEMKDLLEFKLQKNKFNDIANSTFSSARGVASSLPKKFSLQNWSFVNKLVDMKDGKSLCSLKEYCISLFDLRVWPFSNGNKYVEKC